MKEYLLEYGLPFAKQAIGACQHPVDADVLAVVTTSGVDLFDRRKQKVTKRFKGKEEGGTAWVRYDKTGRQLIVARWGGLHFLKAKDLSLISSLDEYLDYFSPVGFALSPDGRSAFV